MAVFEGPRLEEAKEILRRSRGAGALRDHAAALPRAIRRGHISRDGLREVAELLGRTTAEVEAVATFYTMYRLRPTGTHVVSVCTNLACMLRGGREVLDAAHEAAGMRHGDERSDDGMFTVHEEECLGVCDFAPVAQVNFANHDRHPRADAR